MDRRTTIGILGAAPIVALWVYEWIQIVLHWDNMSWFLAVDYQLYMDATRRWLEGGSFYLPHQLAGSYVLTLGDILYPPYSLLLFVPFTVLPAVLWWAIPVAITVAIVIRHRPAPLAWPILAACLWWPETNIKLLTGNPVLWAMAALAAGTVLAWPSVGVLLKLSLFPFALVGVWRRSWWIALAGLGALSLLFLPLWPDYVSVLTNSTNPSGLAYSIKEVPLMLIPLFAWIGGVSRRERAAGAEQPTGVAEASSSAIG